MEIGYITRIKGDTSYMDSHYYRCLFIKIITKSFQYKYHIVQIVQPVLTMILSFYQFINNVNINKLNAEHT